MKREKNAGAGRKGDVTDVEADDVEDLYRSSQAKCGVDVQGSCKDLTAFKDVKRPFLAGKFGECSSSPGTCIPCKLGSRPVLMHRSCKAQRNLMRARAQVVQKVKPGQKGG